MKIILEVNRLLLSWVNDMFNPQKDNQNKYDLTVIKF